MLLNFTMLSNVIIRWDVILIELLILLAISIFLVVFLQIKFRKCIKQLSAKNWNYIVKRERYLKFMSLSKPLYDPCMYMLAVANFELYNDTEFELYVEKIRDKLLWGRKLYLKANYMIVQNESVTTYLNEVLSQLSLLEDDDAKRCFNVSSLLFKIKFEGYTRSSEENDVIKGMSSDRIKKEFLS